MKKYIVYAAMLGTMSLLSFNSYSQKNENEKKKSEEIIIRSNGDKDQKMTIQVDGDNITVNGKPLSEFHDGEVSIMKRDFNDDNSHNFVFTPRNQFNEDGGFGTFNYSNKPRTFLGVETEKADDGLKITNVIKGSSAEKAGLQNGDIISKVDDKKIGSPDDLIETIRAHKPNDEVKIYYSHDSKKKDVKVKLGKTNENNNTYFFNNDKNFNGNFNFKTPRMPRIEGLPKMNYSLWNHNTPKLGLKIQDTEDEKGAKVLEVEAGSAAEKAGLQKDDIITSINGEEIKNVDDAREQLDELNDEATFSLKAKRNNSEMNFDIKIPKELHSADL